MTNTTGRANTPAEVAERWSGRPVTTPEEAHLFLLDCESGIGAGFHPENAFDQYVGLASGGSATDAPRTFTEEQALELELRAEETYRVLGEVGVDPCAVTLDIAHRIHPDLWG